MKRLEVGTLVRIISKTSGVYGCEGVIWRIDLLPNWNKRSPHYVRPWQVWRKRPVAFLVDIKGIGRDYVLRATNEACYYGFPADDLEPIVLGHETTGSWEKIKDLLGVDPRQPVRTKEKETA